MPAFKHLPKEDEDHSDNLKPKGHQEKLFSPFEHIPEDHQVKLEGPKKIPLKVWSCELLDKAGSVVLIEYGDTAEEAAELCMIEVRHRLKKVKYRIEMDAIGLHLSGEWNGRSSAEKIGKALGIPFILEVERIAQAAIDSL